MQKVTPILVLALLAGCGDETPVVAAQADSVAADQKAEIAASYVARESIGKPTLPVTLSYSYLNSPAVDEPVTVRVSVSSLGISDMTATIGTKGALALAKSQPSDVVMKAASATTQATSENLDIVVTPSAEGRSYITLLVAGVMNGRPMTKAVAVPVQVGTGGPALATNGEIIATDVEVLSSLPAQQRLEQPALTP